MLKQLLKNALSLTGYQLCRVQPDADDREMYVRLFGLESVEKRRFYNIGAGGHFGFGCGVDHPCWTNIDVDRPWDNKRQFNPATDIAYDPLSLQTLPLETGSAALVHSRLAIEHMTNEAAANLFREVRRVLMRGGVFRLATPNIDLDYRAYTNKNLQHFCWYFQDDLSIEQKFLSHFAAQPSLAFKGPSVKISDEEFRGLFETMSYEGALDYCTSKCSLDVHRSARQYHINWWNPKKLEQMLRQAGFDSVYPSAPEQSVSPVLCNERYFDNYANKVVTYMEAQKLSD